MHGANFAILIILFISLSCETLFAAQKVLLLYNSGTPYKTISEINSPDELDAVTSPTPVEMNTKKIAEMICERLKQDSVGVDFHTYAEVKDWRKVLEYDLVILGTPTRFWNMSWETKKFVDEIFGKLYVRENKLEGKSFAIFTTAEIGPSCEKTIAALESVIQDCHANVVARLMVHRRISHEANLANIESFCKVISVLARLEAD